MAAWTRRSTRRWTPSRPSRIRPSVRELIGKATGVIASKTPSLSLFTSVLLHGRRKGLENLYFYPNGPIDATKAEFKS